MSKTRAKEMTYRLSSSDSILTVTITGAVTESDSESFNGCFQEITAAKEEKVYLDLRRVPLITSEYIGQLILLFRRLKAQQRELRIKGIHDELFSLFTAINFHKILPIEK